MNKPSQLEMMAFWRAGPLEWETQAAKGLLERKDGETLPCLTQRKPRLSFDFTIGERGLA